MSVTLTTVIVTRDRVPLLARALRSLTLQNVSMINILVVIDDCKATTQFLESVNSNHYYPHVLKWIYCNRAPTERSGPARVASLRNLALSKIDTEFCCYLDDDNEIEPSHYTRLLECMQSGCYAAHSWRTLWSRTGYPFALLDKDPWCRDPEIASNLFKQYRDAGIYQANSNLICDQVVPGQRDQSMVDTSEWLFRTKFLREIGFASKYTAQDWVTTHAEDSKLLDEIVQLGIKVPSTKSPTLRYYMGGYSNEESAEGAAIEGWHG